MDLRGAWSPSRHCPPRERVATRRTPATPNGRSSPAPTGRERPIIYPRRDVVDAIRYLDRTGCQWDALPAHSPHPKLVYHDVKTWTRDATLTRMHNSLRDQVRHHVEGRAVHPTAALVDSPSVRAAETAERTGRSYDAGRK